MFKNKLIILTLITIAVIIAASVFVKLRAPQSEKEKAAFFPGLSSEIEAINHITIKGYAGVVNLSRVNDSWVIDEFDGYPALPDKVKSTVLGAADLKINAPKTKLPRLYNRLGVEGPEVEDSTSLLLLFKDADKNSIVEMIVGKLRLSSASQSTPGLYIRKPNDQQSYLVDGVVDITSSKTDWIERSLFDIPTEAIRAVRVEHADGDTYTLFKNEKGQERFSLENLPSNKKLASELIISRYASILQDIQINGARSKETLEKHDDSINVLIHTFEGMVIELVAFEHDDTPYGSFEFRFDESLLMNNEDQEKIDGIKAFVSNMNAQTMNWWYEIPPFKYDVIKKRSDSIMRNDKTSTKSE
ncbi:MAG: hypothetical protein CMF45_05535 [Legionellales bacterium]|nr:hypothetical protein [Legionellales bacterium]|tara:strand:- start:730 stop:1803 length:1074 start_codon:yes stop_codon:yes gene_type:complete